VLDSYSLSQYAFSEGSFLEDARGHCLKIRKQVLSTYVSTLLTRTLIQVNRMLKSKSILNIFLAVVLTGISSVALGQNKHLYEWKAANWWKAVELWGNPIFSTDSVDLPGSTHVYTYRHGYNVGGSWECITSFAVEQNEIKWARQVGESCPNIKPPKD
jgi:hypothetical protein